MLFTNHLGGTKEDKWTTEYDTAGREKDSGVTAPVGAGGTDMYVCTLHQSSKYSNVNVASALLDGCISKALRLRHRTESNWIW